MCCQMTKIKGFLKHSWFPSPPLVFYGCWAVRGNLTVLAISCSSEVAALQEEACHPPQGGSLARDAFRLLLAQGALGADGLIPSSYL